MASASPSARPRFPRGLLWGGAVLITLLVVIYFCIPWILPADWLAHNLTRRLGEVMNRPVTLGRVTYSLP